MRLIAHRGLMYGPDKEKENTVEQIELALSAGFNVEIDVWYRDDTGFLLGHDVPQNMIYDDLLEDPALWIHCKNEDAFIQMTMRTRQLNYFWHQTDNYTLTSCNIPWVYPGKKLMKTGVCVLPEEFMNIKDTKNLKVYGICSDYVGEIREILR